MYRRRVLQVTGVTVATALAGCLDDDSRTGPPTDGDEPTAEPTSTPSAPPAYEVPIRELWAAYDNENVSGMRAAYHPDSPEAISESEVNFGNDISLETFTVTDRREDALTVAVDATVTERGETQQVTHTYELRRDGGEWAIWRFTVGPADSTEESTPAAPQVAFSFEYDGGAADGSDTGVVTITHTGGDNVDAAALTVRGGGIVAPSGAQPAVTTSGTTWATATGVSSVTAGDSVTVGVASDCEISLVWEDPDDDMSATLAEYDGPDA